MTRELKRKPSNPLLRPGLRLVAPRAFIVAWLVANLLMSQAATAQFAMPNNQPPPMNVLFILADDLGYSDTTLYGTTWFYETPNIEKLARRGMLLRNAYTASPVCSATRASILTGQEPGRLGLTGAGAHLAKEMTASRFRTPEENAARPRQKLKKATVPVAATRVASNVDNLAKALQREGYATGHFGKWHLGAEPHSPLESGFEVDVPHWSGARISTCWGCPRLRKRSRDSSRMTRPRPGPN
jgi:arylsulfatase A-like enzyme